MKLGTFEIDAAARVAAVLSGDRLLDLEAAGLAAAGDMLALLEAGDPALTAARELVRRAEAGELPEAVRPLAAARCLPPVPGCRKLLCVAENYARHIREGGRQVYEKEETYPYFFWKPPTALVGAADEIRYPRIGRQLDWEGELAVVIGRRGHSIPPERALEYVAGYTVLNDISERALASKAPPKAERPRNAFMDWLMGKWFDTSAPCGPWLVTRDELPDPHALRLRTRVNGELKQDGSTADMIFSIPELIAFISRIVTLEPGDLLATGTPSGVGKASGQFLKPGDVVEVEIEGIGALRNPVVAEP